MTSKLYQDVVKKFDAGLASHATKILLEEAKALSRSGEERDIRRSDELARLAIRLHFWGDDLDRQKYRKELREYEALEKKVADAHDELVSILQHYVDIFQRFIPITDTSWDVFRIWTPFERVVRGQETGFSSNEEVSHYLLGSVKDDLTDFIGYVASFSNRFVEAMKRRSIQAGMYHVYGQILLDLGHAEEKYRRIEIIQQQLKDLLLKRQYSPNRPWVTEEEANVRNRINEVLKVS